MMTILRRGRVVALLAVFLLVVAACGDDSNDAEQVPTAPPGAQVSDPLPVNPDPGATPSASGACLEGEPDCQDIPGIRPEPQDLPLPSPDEEPDANSGGGATVSGGALVDGGLTVSEALASTATGVLAVQGFLFDDGSGARLCELFAESYPPQCGGASVPVTGYEEVIAVPLVNAQGVTWTDSAVTLFGEMVDGTLVVDATVAG